MREQTWGIPKPARRVKVRHKRYSYTAVEEAVMNPAFKGYRGGRIEVFDRKDSTGYAVYEARFLLPEAFFDAFYDLWDGKESDLLPRIMWEQETEGREE